MGILTTRSGAMPIRDRFKSEGGVREMGLKAPGIVTFMLSVILAVVTLMVVFFGADIPGIKGNELSFLLTSYGVLVLGCLVKWL
jgi:hypothetical protein